MNSSTQMLLEKYLDPNLGQLLQDYGIEMSDLIGTGTRPFPGGLKRFWYHKEIYPQLNAGLLLGSGEIAVGHLEGIKRLFDAYAAITPAFLNEGVIRQNNFYRAANPDDMSTVVTASLVNVASQRSLTLTVPASRSRNVLMASVRNSTRNPSVRLTYTPFGGTPSVYGDPIGVQSITAVLLGGVGPLNVGAPAGIKGPLKMQTGDTLEIDNPNFVAFDTMRHDIIFEDFDLT